MACPCDNCHCVKPWTDTQEEKATTVTVGDYTDAFDRLTDALKRREAVAKQMVSVRRWNDVAAIAAITSIVLIAGYSIGRAIGWW